MIWATAELGLDYHHLGSARCDDAEFDQIQGIVGITVGGEDLDKARAMYPNLVPQGVDKASFHGDVARTLFSSLKGLHLKYEAPDPGRKYDPKYGDEKQCLCGHDYYRHFDTYANMANVGCKYCHCDHFVQSKKIPEGTPDPIPNHKLKTWPVPFQATADGHKTHELRKNDRNFKVGDLLSLLEFDPKKEVYTGRSLLVKITYVTPGNTHGLPEDMCILSTELFRP